MTKQKNNFTHKILLITLFKSQSARLKIIKKPVSIRIYFVHFCVWQPIYILI